MLGPMKRSLLLVVSVVLGLAPIIDPPLARAAETADIVIYGGTSSGIIAAIQAKRVGKNVVLIEPSTHLGGLTTGGLGATDIGNKAAIGGLAREFYHRVWKHYQSDSAWTRETREQCSRRNVHNEPKDETMWMFEPHVASQIYREW